MATWISACCLVAPPITWTISRILGHAPGSSITGITQEFNPKHDLEHVSFKIIAAPSTYITQKYAKI